MEAKKYINKLEIKGYVWFFSVVSWSFPQPNFPVHLWSLFPSHFQVPSKSSSPTLSDPLPRLRVTHLPISWKQS
jgi:hypothetical protein